MDTRVELAVEKYKNGYNCAQAITCTYCDLFDMDEREMFCMTEALGHGMGNMEGTCGAVSGACVLAGLKGSTGNLEKPESKAKSYALSKAIMSGFKEKNQSVTCGVLKGVGTKVVLCSCPDCVRDAAILVEKILLEKEFVEK